jgi:ubiquinone/menaquinone biosynthesis C-methylase UbiE
MMLRKLPLGLAVALSLAVGADEKPAPPAAHGHGHGEGRHGNPADLSGYIQSQEEPSRDEWQKPDAVVQALALAPGQSACDIGAGPGYFTLRLARAVGRQGHVFAVDVEPAMLAALRERLDRAGLRQVTPVLAAPDDPALPDAACDLVLIVDTYHHFPDPPAYLRGLRRLLRPGGRVVNIDFHKRPTPHGPRLEHRVSREDFVAQARQAGYDVAGEHDFLPYQYFVVLRPR